MGYPINTEIFQNIIEKGIKNHPATYDFIKRQAAEILEEQRLIWEGKQATQEEIDDPEGWYDYLHDARKKFEKYMYRWFDDVGYNISIIEFQDKLPSEILNIFNNLLDEVYDHLNFEGYSWEIMDEIFEDFKDSKLGVKK